MEFTILFSVSTPCQSPTLSSFGKVNCKVGGGGVRQAGGPGSFQQADSSLPKYSSELLFKKVSEKPDVEAQAYNPVWAKGSYRLSWATYQDPISKK